MPTIYYMPTNLIKEISMSVVKKGHADWRYYLRQLAESCSKISDMEKIEFAGHLLRRDMEKGGLEVFQKIMIRDDCHVADIMASFMIAESPETVEDLLNTVQYLIVDHYAKEMEQLIKDEIDVVAAELKGNREDPRNEYDPDENAMCGVKS